MGVHPVFNEPTPASNAPYTSPALQTHFCPSPHDQGSGRALPTPPWLSQSQSALLPCPQWEMPLSTRQLDGFLLYHGPLPNATEGRPPGRLMGDQTQGTWSKGQSGGGGWVGTKM